MKKQTKYTHNSPCFEYGECRVIDHSVLCSTTPFVLLIKLPVVWFFYRLITTFLGRNFRT